MSYLEKIEAAATNKQQAELAARKAATALNELIVTGYKSGESVTAMRKAAGYKTATAVYNVLYKVGLSGAKGERMS